MLAEETAEETALRGFAPLRKEEENMPVRGCSGSLGSCLKRDSRRLRDEGLRPGFGLGGGPSPNASTVRLLLSPASVCLLGGDVSGEQELRSCLWSKFSRVPFRAASKACYSQPVFSKAALMTSPTQPIGRGVCADRRRDGATIHLQIDGKKEEQKMETRRGWRKYQKKHNWHGIFTRRAFCAPVN
ncbi:hypothetical protein SRHO_G00002310 [Serrasalmus rhombeus]